MQEKKAAPSLKEDGDSASDGEKLSNIFDEMEPKVRQQVKIVGRTLFCFRCDGSKEMASYYCACGSFLCTIHLAEHSCLVSASMQYNEELMGALC